ncbi:hypothetical protein DB347_18140 [Opitutaceae bacterium EW11]|nr:hypothetical protein DB347_18140 [Opitutaceae bacterium EW11]
MTPEKPDSDFNRPAEIAVRVIYLIYLSLAVASLISGVYALALQRLDFAAAALLGTPLAYLCRRWLQEESRYEVAESFDFPAVQQEESHHNEQLADFIGLVETWDRLEARRGTPEFDPWELQSVRHEIQHLIDKTPSWARLFRRSS